MKTVKTIKLNDRNGDERKVRVKSTRDNTGHFAWYIVQGSVERRYEQRYYPSWQTAILGAQNYLLCLGV